MKPEEPTRWFLQVRTMTEDQAIAYLMKLLDLDRSEATQAYQTAISLPYDEVIITQDDQEQ